MQRMTEIPGLVSVVIPVYNSADTLKTLVERLLKVFQDGTHQCEILMVNDGSQDLSWRVIKNLASENPQVSGLNLMRNFGQHNALLAGIREAKGAVIVTMDDDLQNPPEEIPRLLGRLEEGFDVVYGVPEKEKHGLLRDAASIMIKIALRWALGFRHASHTSAFRAFRTRLRLAFADFRSTNVSIDVLLTWGTTKFAHVEVKHQKRQRGRSGYNFRKLATHAINMVTSFSTLPLRIATLVGFVFMLFGVAVQVRLLLMYFFSTVSVPGFTFLASLIAIFSGVQLFSLGIIGEYIARIHSRALERPPYLISGKTNP